MQGDLISRTRLRTEVDLLLERKMISPNTMAMLHRLIDGQPTAYDVEKVVAELNEECFYTCDYGCVNDNYKALEIVRNGGKE